MPVFVVADAHGRHDLVEGLLNQERLLRGQRADGTAVVHVGDLINAVASSISDDLECLRRAREWFDVYLVGNHEHPYFGGPRFSGFWRDPEIERALFALESIIQPTLAYEGVLVSHAGLTVEMAGPEEDHSGWETAEAADEEIRWAWSQRSMRGTIPLFAAIGWSRGGSSRFGGILWSDWEEPKALAFNQVVGHSVGREVRWQRRDGKFAVCIDLGASKEVNGALAGAWIRDGEVEVVTYAGEAAVSA